MPGHYDYLDGKKGSTKAKLPAVPVTEPSHVDRTKLGRVSDYVPRSNVLRPLCCVCGERPIDNKRKQICGKCDRRARTNQGHAQRGRLTDEEKHDIVKRVKNWERPIDVAKRYNVTTETIMKVMKESRKPS